MQLPLSGVRVCDFTWVGAGPYATKLLADFGAEVIKVETATRPDVLRLTGPFKDGKPGLNRSGYFSNRNTSKKSIRLNLSTAEGRDIARQLIRVSDVVCNNFSPGTMEKWGFGYEECRKLRPDIIYLSMPMYGNSGPYRDYIGFGASIAAMIGLTAMTRFPGGSPLGTGTNYPDHAPNPYHAALAVLAALRHRRRTGQGQCIELSQVESAAAAVGQLLLEALNLARDPDPRGNRHPAAAPHGVYPCLGEDRWVAIACFTEQEWLALARLAGQGWEMDERFRTLVHRLRHADALDEQVAAWTKTQEPHPLVEKLQEAGVPAEVVQTPQDLLQDPQLQLLGHWVRLPHPEMGPTLYDAPPIRLSRTPGALRSPAPLLGQHTEEVLIELLGLAPAEVRRLQEAGVLD